MPLRQVDDLCRRIRDDTSERIVHHLLLAHLALEIVAVHEPRQLARDLAVFGGQKLQRLKR